jgi:hypothetical protein
MGIGSRHLEQLNINITEIIIRTLHIFSVALMHSMLKPEIIGNGGDGPSEY